MTLGEVRARRRAGRADEFEQRIDRVGVLSQDQLDTLTDELGPRPSLLARQGAKPTVLMVREMKLDTYHHDMYKTPLFKMSTARSV